MQVEKPRFFEWQQYRSGAAPELAGGANVTHPVVVVGGGPVGLALALILARHDVSVVLLEAKDQVSDSSRTLAVARRSVQLLDRLGLAEKFRTHAITREFNYVYHGTQLVRQSRYGADPQEKFPDISVLQQPWTEHIILEGVLAMPNVDLRWQHRVTEIDTSNPQRNVLTVSSPEGEYTIAARYVIAADGARGQVRRSMGLKFDEIGDGVLPRQFVICDFELPTDLPIARRLWICPPYRPRSAVLLHRQPFDTWRLDYALEDDEDIEQAMQPEAVARNVREQLSLLGLPTEGFRLTWISSYRPMSRSLPQYRHGSVFFAGDAAHQTPIFGGRGMNQGLLDAANLGWKLALVLKQQAPESLLDTYDAERRPLIVQNLHDIALATLCMTAPTRGASLMRKAAFDLLPTETFVLPLIDAFNANKSESLHPDDNLEPDAPLPGNPLPDCRLRVQGKEAFLNELLNLGRFTALNFVDPLAADGATQSAAESAHFDEVTVHIRGDAATATGVPVFEDETARARLDAKDGDWLLIRPDGYIHARLSRPAEAEKEHAFWSALGQVEHTEE